jgi:precorrin-6x reductase
MSRVKFEVRYADGFRYIEAETAEDAAAIATALDAKVNILAGRPIVGTVEITRDEDSLFWRLLHAVDQNSLVEPEFDDGGMEEERRRHP